MKLHQLLAYTWLVLLLAFTWGFASQRYHLFPYTLPNIYFSYVEGMEKDPSTLLGKLQNDFGIRPERLLRTYQPQNADALKTVDIEGLSPRRNQPRMQLSDHTPAFRVLIAAFDFTDAFWDAIMIDEAGTIVHTWKLSGTNQTLERKDINSIINGASIFPDGSIIFNMNMERTSLIKRDYCSDLLWSIEGPYHHAATATASYDTFWTFSGYAIDANPVFDEMSAADGSLLRRITGVEIQEHNPELHIFDLRDPNNLTGKQNVDSPHHNDIEALPVAYAAAFPQFTPGDLLINYRSTNLVYVLDPKTLKVKYWHFGAGDGAHDADWQPDGTITLFSNNWRSGYNSSMPPYSSIVSIDPKTNKHWVSWDGAKQDLFSPITGRYQLTPSGNILIASGTQGRFLEVNPETNDVLFEFINDYDRSQHKVLHVAEVFYLPKNFFNFDVYDMKRCQLKDSDGHNKTLIKN